MQSEAEKLLNRQRALVIDDENGVRSIISRALGLLKIHVEAAEDGFQGVAMFRSMQDDIDLVLLDLNMPGKSGKETLKEIREIRSDTRILIMSGMSADDMSDNIDNNQNIEFIEKPFPISFLQKKVTGILDFGK